MCELEEFIETAVIFTLGTLVVTLALTYLAMAIHDMGKD